MIGPPTRKFQVYKHLSCNVGNLTTLMDLVGVYFLGAGRYHVGVPLIVASLVITTKANYIYYWLLERLTERGNDARESI